MRTKTTLALSTFLGLSSALGCFSNRKANIPVETIQGVIDTVKFNSFDPPFDFPIEVKAQHAIGGANGDTSWCVENNFLFDNTHVSQEDIISALEAIRDDCDRFGGKRQGHGDTGLPVDITLTSTSNSACK